MNLNLPMSTKQAQEFLDNFPYDSNITEENYRISSPKVTLKRGSAMCIDGAILAAYLTNENPNILYMASQEFAHCVLITENSGLFGSIGKSSNPDLLGRPYEFKTIDELAKSYKEIEVYSTHKWDHIHPNWKTTKKDMNPGIDFWMKNLTYLL